MNNDLEKKWREEYRLLGFMDGDEIYLAARKAAQVEIDELKLCKNYDSFTETSRKFEHKNKELERQLKDLEQENERLKVEIKLSQPLYSRRELQDQLKEQSELIKQLKALGTCDIDCDGVNCSKTCIKKSVLFEKAKKIGEKK